MTTGEKIRYYRQLRHLTQEELGRKCIKRQAGKPDTTIAGSTIRSYERGTLNPKTDTLKIIAAALDIYWTELLDDDSMDTAMPLLEGGSEIASYYMTKYAGMMDAHQLWLWISEQVQRYQKCGGEKAGKLASLILKCVLDSLKADEILAFSTLLDIVSSDYMIASHAVLEAGVEEALRSQGKDKGLVVEKSHGKQQEFNIWENNAEAGAEESWHTVGLEVNADEAFAIIRDYYPKSKKPPQAEKPEAEE